MAEQAFQIGIKALVRDGDGKILLLREAHHPDSYWDIPGGRMDPGENFMQTLSRELAEEIGVQFSGAAEHVATVMSNKTITDERGTFGLVLVIYSVQLASHEAITSVEEGVLLDWFMPTEAAERLADKYPAEFCDAIRRLT